MKHKNLSSALEMMAKCLIYNLHIPGPFRLTVELHLININPCCSPLKNQQVIFKPRRKAHFPAQAKMVKELRQPRAKSLMKAELTGGARRGLGSPVPACARPVSMVSAF